MNVLVTGIGSTTAQSVAKGLRKQDAYPVRITGTDINERTEIAGPRVCDSFHRIPPATDTDAYIERLVEIVDDEEIDLVVPIVEAELTALAEHREPLESRAELLLSSAETVEICNDKLRTYEFFRDAGVPTPATVHVSPEEEVAEQIDDLSYPLVAKPRRGVSSRNVYEIRNEDELPLIERIEDPMVQEKVSGQEYTIDTFREGREVTAVVPRARLETRSGISYKGETVDDERLVDLGRRVTDALDIYGPANIQCFVNGDTVTCFEVNPRFSGSLPLTIEAGVNTTRSALELARSEEVNRTTSFESVRMCRYWEEVYYER